MKEFDYDLDYKTLILQLKRIANFIALEGRTRSATGTALH